MSIQYRSKPLTQGNLDNHHIYITPFLDRLPPDAIGGSQRSDPAPAPIRLHWRSRSTVTDVPSYPDGRGPRPFFRDRAFTREVLADAGAAVGDVVIFEQLGSHEFRLHLEKPGGRRVS